MNDLRKITIAAMKAATNEDEVLYVFQVFKIKDLKNKVALLEETMGGQFFNLPNEEKARYEALLQTFLHGQWRYAEKFTELRKFVNNL